MESEPPYDADKPIDVVDLRNKVYGNGGKNGLLHELESMNSALVGAIREAREFHAEQQQETEGLKRRLSTIEAKLDAALKWMAARP